MKSIWWMSCLAMLGLCGCNPVIVPAYDPVGGHTLKVAPDQDADVVWLQKLNVEEKRTQLFRCHNSPQGPQCIEAKTP